MSTIHRTTMTPTKLELLTDWLPKQSWYVGDAQATELVRAGGFRLDDPEGAVGIEFMVVVDSGAPGPVAYLVPMAYRGTALADAPDEALIGTSEHGVLGTRWIYDGLQDPVVRARLRALLRGEAIPQHQNESDTPDPTVTVTATATATAHDTDPDDGLDVRINRVLRPTEATGNPSGRLVAGWTWPDGTAARGVLA
ncbi:maltokinase N-terminal cap-like domain-containing protein [Streptomyces apocyni]|uniref:maltokinase N-terminal cap-like domain-containing protein n=1 Tax=Streptomyces apocyni TaxID=2654677 RepID=UPI0012EAA073|nr:1,4-alpha-glucan branching protein [Streptomyces apocyni]